MQEGRRLQDGAVDVRLGGEVDDGVALGGQLPHERLVSDVGLHEAVAVACGGVVGQPGQVGRIPGVGELVHDRDLVVRAGQAPTHEGRADEAGTAGDQEPPGLAVRLDHPPPSDDCCWPKQTRARRVLIVRCACGRHSRIPVGTVRDLALGESSGHADCGPCRPEAATLGG